jgi:hypothetical protein
LALVLVFFNARSIANKADVFKSFMTDKRAAYGGISESKTHNDTAGLSDSTFRWDAGTEGKPKSGSGPTRGMGAFIDRTAIKASIVETGTYTMWHRVETRTRNGEGKSKPIFVGVGYFPDSQDKKGHAKANKELARCLRKYRDLGHVVFGGDLNAHTGLNNDETPVDDAGLMLLTTVNNTDMLLVNAMGSICSRFKRGRSSRARWTTSSAPPPWRPISGPWSSTLTKWTLTIVLSCSLWVAS